MPIERTKDAKPDPRQMKSALAEPRLFQGRIVRKRTLDLPLLRNPRAPCQLLFTSAGASQGNFREERTPNDFLFSAIALSLF